MEILNDIVGYRNLKIYQNTDYFSFSLDSILLANFVSFRLVDKDIVDLCCGNGVIPLILSKKTNNKIFGVEIQEKLCELARKSIIYNNLNDRIEIINSDLKDFSKKNNNKFDIVICNPPYFKTDNSRLLNISYEKMVARHEVLINLSELLNSVKILLKNNGKFFMVHRTDRLLEILDELRKNNLEPKNVKFVYENHNKGSTLVLIESHFNGSSGLKIDKPLILFDENGNKTAEYKKILKEVY